MSREKVFFFPEMLHHNLGWDSKHSLVCAGLRAARITLMGTGRREGFNGIVLFTLRTLTDEKEPPTTTTTKVMGAYNCAAN